MKSIYCSSRPKESRSKETDSIHGSDDSAEHRQSCQWRMRRSTERPLQRRKIYTLILFSLLIGLGDRTGLADSTFVYAVQISAVVETNPPQINLSWEVDPYGANNYTIYRKAKDDTTWGSPLATLDGSASNYVDTAVSIGSSYEYQIIKAATLGYTGYGYIYSGINLPPTEQRGTVVLVVATNSTIGLDLEVARLQTDLVGDGWQVLREDVSSNDTPDNVHARIVGDYWADPTNINTVFLLGHVPILQSGYLNYDGHGARPMAADAYYGDVNNDWPTDLTNSPSYLPSDVTLMVGRVDLANLPGNAATNPWPSETELLRNYLNKDHNWRQGLVQVPRQALMGNRRGDEGGLATAASGYRNFEPFVGPGQTIEANIADVSPPDQRWISMLATSTYLWAYGCGAGQDTAIGYLGLHGTSAEVWSIDIVGQDAQAVFVMVFGSHLGNWDHPDNIMRSVLATPTLGLACCMSGQPHWFLHHMGLGETIGYGTRLTMNNSTLYQTESNLFTRAVYIALMGDPTLRMEPIPAPSSLTTTVLGNQVTLQWAGAPTVAGYYVYRASTPNGPFARVTSSLLTSTNYTDPAPAPGSYTYLVRAVALVTNPSGSYFDPSEGITANAGVTSAPAAPLLSVSLGPYGPTVSWNAQLGAVYQVERTDNLGAPSWKNLSGTIQATETNASWTDLTGLGSSQLYYRVVSP